MAPLDPFQRIGWAALSATGLPDAYFPAPYTTATAQVQHQGHVTAIRLAGYLSSEAAGAVEDL